MGCFWRVWEKNVSNVDGYGNLSRKKVRDVTWCISSFLYITHLIQNSVWQKQQHAIAGSHHGHETYWKYACSKPTECGQVGKQSSFTYWLHKKQTQSPREGIEHELWLNDGERGSSPFSICFELFPWEFFHPYRFASSSRFVTAMSIVRFECHILRINISNMAYFM